jgi:uncharacterized protein (DUF488 family)
MHLQNLIYTIGHSTLSLEAFLDLLKGHGVECLVDIRRFPGSRKYPHFNREPLQASLHEAGIDYVWLEHLGGRRGRQKSNESPNTALRNESFRNYADYMATDDFRQGIDELLELAKKKVTAYMCSEAVYWRCHRRLVSDYLLANGIVAQHIMSAGKPRPHTLTEGAVIADGAVTYPGQAQP